jgi:hypothetical protein
MDELLVVSGQIIIIHIVFSPLLSTNTQAGITLFRITTGILILLQPHQSVNVTTVNTNIPEFSIS